MNAKWIRVNKKRRCEICEHPDWCTYSPDLGLVLCMRVESARPSTNSMGGWIHRVSDPRPSYAPPVRHTPEPVSLDCRGLWNRWLAETDSYHVDGFAMTLGVATDALRAVGCAWSGKAWAFPMYDGDCQIIGIRLRDDQGRKWAVTGSRSGLFIPSMEGQSVLYICEGPTDVAAGLTIGLYAIGRPSCQGQEDLILRFIRRQQIRSVIIITDNDEPGLRGARKLQSQLKVSSCLWATPCKDLREFVGLGGNKADIESSIKDIVWSRAA